MCLSFPIKDFEAARKKALDVGAKKFFVEVIQINSVFAADTLTARPIGPETRVCH